MLEENPDCRPCIATALHKFMDMYDGPGSWELVKDLGFSQVGHDLEGGTPEDECSSVGCEVPPDETPA
jgi:hypothetical protein